MNPLAIIMWLFFSLIGYLVSGPTGALWGFTIGLGLSLFAELL